MQAFGRASATAAVAALDGVGAVRRNVRQKTAASAPAADGAPVHAVNGASELTECSGEENVAAPSTDIPVAAGWLPTLPTLPRDTLHVLASSLSAEDLGRLMQCSRGLRGGLRGAVPRQLALHGRALQLTFVPFSPVPSWHSCRFVCQLREATGWLPG